MGEDEEPRDGALRRATRARNRVTSRGGLSHAVPRRFHDDAWIFFTDADGGLNKGLLTECFEEWAAPPRANIVGRLISVQQAGDVACVLLGFDDLADPTNCWVDFHLLLRIDGAWKITNKTATHSSKAAWAGAGAVTAERV